MGSVPHGISIGLRNIGPCTLRHLNIIVLYSLRRAALRCDVLGVSQGALAVRLTLYTYLESVNEWKRHICMCNGYIDRFVLFPIVRLLYLQLIPWILMHYTCHTKKKNVYTGYRRGMCSIMIVIMCCTRIVFIIWLHNNIIACNYRTW